MTATISCYADKLYILLNTNHGTKFISKIKKALLKNIAPFFKSDISEEFREYMIIYATSAFAGVFNYWYESGKKANHTELAKIVNIIATQGLLKLLNN